MHLYGFMLHIDKDIRELAASLQSLVTKLSPNNKIVLRKKAKKYIVEDVLGSDADDF